MTTSPPPPSPFPAWAWALVGVILGGLAGGGLGATVAYRYRPEDRYVVNAFLTNDATAEQKERIEAAFPERPKFRNREETFREARELWKDRPDILQSLRPEDMRDVYSVNLRSRGFDCDLVTPISRLPGVEEVSVAQEAAGDRPGASLACPQ